MKVNKARVDEIRPNRSSARPPEPRVTGASRPVTEGTTRDLIRELRQPLSSIEAIAYYLEMTFPFDQTGPRQQMRQLQQLVEETNSILKNADAGACKNG